MPQKFKAYISGVCNNFSSYKEGGSAYMIVSDGISIKESAKGFTDTTNNRMDLLAILSVLTEAPAKSILTIFSSNGYCICTFRNGTLGINEDLIIRCHELIPKFHKVYFKYAKRDIDKERMDLVNSMALDKKAEIIAQYNIPEPKPRKYPYRKNQISSAKIHFQRPLSYFS